MRGTWGLEKTTQTILATPSKDNIDGWQKTTGIFRSMDHDGKAACGVEHCQVENRDKASGVSTGLVSIIQLHIVDTQARK